MTRAKQLRRLTMLTALLVAGFCGLALRLVDLQVIRHEELSVKARGNSGRNYLREPGRGDIRDINGNLLATCVQVKTICADPVLIGDRHVEMAHVLSPLLQLPSSQLESNLMKRVIGYKDEKPVFDQYVRLRQKVLVDDWERMAQVLSSQDFGYGGRTNLTADERRHLHNLRTRAVWAEDAQMRVYPNGNLAAHVLGFVGSGRHPDEMAGKDGIELVLNTKLSGVRGWRETERDRRGRELVEYRRHDVEPRDGLNAILTIDSVLQEIVERELAETFGQHTPESVSAVVVRPRTGEILAMATLPDFDPNRPGNAEPDQRRNRVITDFFEPGSTFKVVVVSGALSDGLVRLEDVFDCENGRFVYAGRSLKDDHAYGLLNVQGIIAKSSNIGAAKIGLRMGEKRLYELIREFGFGQRTGIPLPGEAAGISHPPERWDRLTITRIPMGHAIATTSLQMAMAMSAIANRGQLMHPMLVDRLEDGQGGVATQYYPQKIRDVISPAAAADMVAALKVAASTNGTGRMAMLEHYTVAGKTGTAQKAGRGGYLPGKYYASFIGFFPADRPELCIAVTIDEPRNGYYGGTTAAPAFKRIAEQAAVYLKIPPDRGLDSGGETPVADEGSAVGSAKLARSQ